MNKNIIILLTLLITTVTNIFAIEVFVIDRDLDIPLEGVLIKDIENGVETFTDFNGKATLEVANGATRLIIVAELIGYESNKQLVTDFSKVLYIKLLMEGILEGKELVVEVEAIGETDAEVGVSTVIEAETIQAAAKIGVIEDVMTAVKILPGVTYSGGFGSGMSVRGGDPSGVTASLDGFITQYPNHWGGAFSIFNPNIVESIKFSPGVFSVKNGQATSALLEVNSVEPTDGTKFSSIISTSTIETFYQTQFGQDDQCGVLGGFRLTNYDLAMKSIEELGKAMDSKELLDTVAFISRAPYIYDFYLKGVYAPSETFKFHINGFWGNDGIGVSNMEDDGDNTGIKNSFDFFYKNSDFFVNTNLKVLPSEKLLIQFMLGYEYWAYDLEANMREEGHREYSDSFLAAFSGIIPSGVTGYDLYTESNWNEKNIKQSLQTRLDFDFSLSENYLLQSGFGSTMDISSGSTGGEMWMLNTDDLLYAPTSYNEKQDDVKNIISFAYFNFNGTLIPDFLKLDLGVRVDHSYFVGEDNYNLNTYPEFAPRVNFTITPSSDSEIFKSNVFSLGVGLFNKNPFGTFSIDKDWGVEDFDLVSEKTLLTVLGMETMLPKGYRFKIEGYYKYFFDRFYNNFVDNEVILHFDGYGHAIGGDLLLEKKISRYLDGLLSYTFVYARFNDPKSDGASGEENPFASYQVRGQDYYPYFHRFHTLNLLVNYKPKDYFTFTTKLSFATGNPRNDYGEPTVFPLRYIDVNGETKIAEIYSRSTIYSEKLRTQFSLPLDLKFSWHSYIKQSKYEWEIYFAIQDLLSPVISLLQADDTTTMSKWDGKAQDVPSAGFSFPIPSIGVSLSF